VGADTRHNIINGPSGSMKLYTLYALPNHRDGIVHAAKGDAKVDEEHFDGKPDRIGRDEGNPARPFS
jgi:hypothetical protein